ncbi:tetratricopeptide repeat protein [Aquimarina agarivorans]|uniref:tetratricopeptide repeat protein n=1 Tax=Aquimarina agarivorans TaxID=980584 RepID=UPI000248EA4E|nr:tetratricopeptide repeat protein [Aquimarina agarivorans]
MKKSLIITWFFVLVSTLITAQQTEIFRTTNNSVYQKALDLYNNKEYAAAQSFFRKVQSTTEDQNIRANAAYYIAQSAVRMQQKGADVLMTNFVTDYPTHPKRNSAFLGVGNYYFSVGKYARARKWYQDVDKNRLNTSALETFYFNKGYSLYHSKRYDDAQKSLQKVTSSEKYGEQAKYYLGYIAYNANNYEQADTYFDEVSDSKDYNKTLSYYKADRNFKKGDFQKAIDSAEPRLATAKPNDKSQLNKIIGESYFNLKLYQKAIPYLEAYKGNKGKWSNTDYYLLGYSYYKNGDYSKAVSQFNKIIDGKNAVSQNAYYHLADAYLKSAQKQQALNAFKNASEMNFEAIIKEDATYNYAKLSYEIGNSFESVPSVLKSFLLKYPDSPQKQEIARLLVDSYLSTKNYKEALGVLDSGKGTDNKEVFQKVLFYRGLEVFKEKDFKEAILLFDRAITINALTDFTQRALFWKGESYYEQEDYVIAISNYEAITDVNTTNWSELKLKEYQLGYSNFKIKAYAKAIKHFNQFLAKNPEKFYMQDATLRLADSYFVTANYWPAMETYNKAIAQKHKRADYAHFQKAISYGFVNKQNRKIEDLKAFLVNFPDSNFRDDAYYALANAYVAKDEINKGLANYAKLRNELPNSALVSKALLKEGLIFYNDNKSQKALGKFKTLVAEHPNTPEALQAVKTARLVYIDLGQTDAYASWVKSLDFVDISNEELDNTTYEAAEKPYQENNTAKAIVGFEKYLNEFPKGLHQLNSHFYLAQLYSKKGNKEKALTHYLAVSALEKNEYSETALYKISQTYLENKAYSKAIPYLKRLEKIADFDQNTIFAQSNLMKSFYEQKQFDETLAYAEKVLANTNIETSIKADAKIYKARAALALGKYDEAKQAYAEVAKIATGKLGAEAIYNLANFSTNNKDFEISNNYVQQLAKDYSAYKEYGAKGLVLMAKNFNGLGDAYQATYLLESISKEFTEYPEVVAEAKSLLQTIRAEEAKTNSSIKE